MLFFAPLSPPADALYNGEQWSSGGDINRFNFKYLHFKLDQPITANQYQIWIENTRTGGGRKKYGLFSAKWINAVHAV